MTERENFFETLHRKKPQWTPCIFDSYHLIASSAVNNQGVPLKGGRDMFGVNWLVTEDTGFMPTPDPHEQILDDICNWRDVVHFPDVNTLEWENAVKEDLKGFDRDSKVLCMFTMEGNFNRLQSLVGICEGLMALLEDPESVYDFFQANTNFTCQIIDKIIAYYKPDILIYGDDVCSSEGMMFSKSIYDELIRPFENQIGQRIVKQGVIYEHHVCGKAEKLIPDIIENGALIWQTAQSMNDLAKIQSEYGDKLLVHGGWDSFGAHNFGNATKEMVCKEVRRCLDSYWNEGFYMLMPVIIGQKEDQGFQNRCRWASEECRTYSEKKMAALNR